MSGGADVLEILEICAHYLVNAFPPFYPGFWIYVCEGDVSVVTVSIFLCLLSHTLSDTLIEEFSQGAVKAKSFQLCVVLESVLTDAGSQLCVVLELVSADSGSQLYVV